MNNDTNQPIYISSDNQALNMKDNVVTFTGNVVLRQGSIDIRANKVIVTRPNSKSSKEVIEAFGEPATFHQIMQNGKPIDGSALKMRYDTAIEFLKMTNNAELIQEGSEIKGNVITYNISEQKLIAEGGKNKRVTTILQPNQFNQKKK